MGDPTEQAEQARQVRQSRQERPRLVACAAEMRQVHDRLRGALRVTRAALAEGGDAESASRDLLLYCHGFCAALIGHHEGEDATLFPAIVAVHPELAATVAKLEQDHAMIGTLLTQLTAVVDRGPSPAELEPHVEGIAAIMESHFRYEERELLGVLETLDLDAEVAEVFGPL